VTGQVRRWLDLPSCATALFIPLPLKILGFDLILPSLLLELCQVGTDLTLIHSRDLKMGILYKTSHNKMPIREFIILASRREVIKLTIKRQMDNQLVKLDNLKIQSVILKSLRFSLPLGELESWAKHMALLTPVLSNFARKTLIRCLPTNSTVTYFDGVDQIQTPAPTAKIQKQKTIF